MTYIIHKSNDLDLRQQISQALNELEARIDSLQDFVSEHINAVSCNLAADWPIIDNTVIPIQANQVDGTLPPTVAVDTITIVSPGAYIISATCALATGGSNTVSVEIEYNGVPVGRVAEADQAGGQGDISFQGSAGYYNAFAVAGDTIQFRAYTVSGGTVLANATTFSVVQQQHDFE